MREPEWSVDEEHAAGRVTLRGVFRLDSPEAYDRVFAPALAAIEAGEAYTLDLRDVLLMNSSGIRALADLVLAARRAASTLTFVARAEVPWQSKTMASLRPLYDDLVVELT